MTPNEFIATIVDVFGRYESPNDSGKCLKVFFILKQAYPQAEMYYNSDHVIAKIDGSFYDIDGIVPDTSSYLPAQEFGRDYFEAAFDGLIDKTHLNLLQW